MPTVPVHPPRSPSRRFRTAAPLGRRSGQEVFNGERIGGVLAGASTVRCGPKTYSLQTGALCLSRECLTITKALRGVGEVVGLGSAVQLRRTERRQRGIRVCQDALQEFIVCCTCRNQIAGKINT